MLFQARLDERFLDRRGCGDELYADAHQRASMWLAGISGAQSLDGADLDSSDDESLDGFASH
jgi:hypothetical protein